MRYTFFILPLPLIGFAHCAAEAFGDEEFEAGDCLLEDGLEGFKFFFLEGADDEVADGFFALGLFDFAVWGDGSDADSNADKLLSFDGFNDRFDAAVAAGALVERHFHAAEW